MEKKQGAAGIGLDVNVDLKLGEITGLVDMLASALQETGEKAKSKIAEAVGKLREAGGQKLKKASEKEGGNGDATKAYKRALKELQTAMDRGDAEAKKLLGEMKA